MASMRELKNRLRSVNTTRQLAGAMRTVSSAKYSRLTSLLEKNAPYAEACREAVRGIGCAGLFSAFRKSGAESGDKPNDASVFEGSGQSLGPVFVLISGNRGLCGGYNHELFGFFNSEVLKKQASPALVVCGRMAEEYLKEKGISPLASFPAGDVPTFDEASALAEYLVELYSGGGCESVSFVCQRFFSMVKQSPGIVPFLPQEREDEAGTEDEGHGRSVEPMLYIPDEASVRGELVMRSLKAEVYLMLLRCAAGAQAATVMAMRSAYDNAGSSARLLETAINRKRQTEVTQSVLETSADTGGGAR